MPLQLKIVREGKEAIRGSNTWRTHHGCGGGGPQAESANGAVTVTGPCRPRPPHGPFAAATRLSKEGAWFRHSWPPLGSALMLNVGDL